MKIILLIIFWAIFALMLLKLISTVVSIFSGSPSGETTEDQVKKLFKKLKPKKGSVIYDPGCGFGNVGMALVKNFDVKVTGFEVSPLPYLSSKIRSLFTKNYTVKYANIKNIDYKKADIVYCYLLPGLLSHIAPKLKKELKKGSIVVSQIFEIKDLKKTDEIMIDNRRFHIYKIK